MANLNKKKRRPRQRGITVTPGTTSAGIMVPAKAGRARKRQRPGGNNSGDGTVRLQRSELVKEVHTDANGAVRVFVDLLPDNFTFLGTVWKAFERYRWHSLRIFYKPAVGTTASGLVSYGIDYTITKNNIDRAAIAALTPNVSHALWNDSTKRPLVIPASMLQSRTWYLASGDAVDKCAGRLCIAASGATGVQFVGEIWASYDVTLSGTRS